MSLALNFDVICMFGWPQPYDGYFGTRADYSQDDQAKLHESLLFDVGGGVGI